MTYDSEQDLYALFGLPETVTAREIRIAPKARIKELHPDRTTGDGMRAAQLNQARDILLDPRRRTDYDERRRAYWASLLEPFDASVRVPGSGEPPAPLWSVAVGSRWRAVTVPGSSWRRRWLVVGGIAVAAVGAIAMVVGRGRSEKHHAASVSGHVPEGHDHAPGIGAPVSATDVPADPRTDSGREDDEREHEEREHDQLERGRQHKHRGRGRDGGDREGADECLRS